MIKIIKEGKNPYTYHAECSCGCEFTCNREDLHKALQPNGRDYHMFVICPTCSSCIPFNDLKLI